MCVVSYVAEKLALKTFQNLTKADYSACKTEPVLCT